jgi:hypothetical protein
LRVGVAVAATTPRAVAPGTIAGAPRQLSQADWSPFACDRLPTRPASGSVLDLARYVLAPRGESGRVWIPSPDQLVLREGEYSTGGKP